MWMNIKQMQLLNESLIETAIKNLISRQELVSVNAYQRNECIKRARG